MRTFLIQSFVAFIVMTFARCTCRTSFETNPSNPGDAVLDVAAEAWQGKYDYLAFYLRIKTSEPLFVKDITIIPSRQKKEFFPEFDTFEMSSSHFEGDDPNVQPYMHRYRSKLFKDLPENKRKTEIKGEFVQFTAFYESSRTIRFEEFEAYITVILLDDKGKESTHSNKFSFVGKRHCRFAVH